jgi:hypothetical protein
MSKSSSLRQDIDRLRYYAVYTSHYEGRRLTYSPGGPLVTIPSGPGLLAAPARVLALVHEVPGETAWKLDWRSVNEAKSLAGNAKIRSPRPSLVGLCSPGLVPVGPFQTVSEGRFSELRIHVAA